MSGAPTIDWRSAATCQLVPRSGDHALASATGIIVKWREHFYLVSNWHVFSGRNTYTGQPLDPHFRVPGYLRFTFWRGRSNLSVREETIELLDDKGTAQWLMHPRGQEIDLAAIRLHSAPIRTVAMDLTNEPRVAPLRAGSDVAIIGFLPGLQKQGPLPVWKTGMISSEPSLPVDGIEGLLLVDSLTMKGMSGSPVFFRVGGRYTTENTIVHASGLEYQFVGIYSGRYPGQKSTDGLPFLGRVWRRRYLEEILENGIPGDWDHATYPGA
jgi:hypothetical protein